MPLGVPRPHVRGILAFLAETRYIGTRSGPPAGGYSPQFLPNGRTLQSMATEGI